MTARPSAEHTGGPAAGTPAGNAPPASLWRDWNFAAFWTAQAMSQLGAQLAFPVLAVTLLGATELEVGILSAAGLAAFLVVGLPAGAWVDRWLKRRTMITSDLVRMAAMAAVPLLWWAGALQIGHLYVISAVVGVATVFFDVSYQSFASLLGAPGKVGEANSKLEATVQLARIGGPAAGGALLTVLTAPLLFIGESLGYLLSAVFLGRTRDGERRLPAAGRNSLGAEIREGLGFVAARPLIRRIVPCTGGGNFAGTLVFTLLPVLVLRHRDAQAPGQRGDGQFLGSCPRGAPHRRRRHRLRCHHQCQRNNDVGPPRADDAVGIADPHQIAQRIRQAIRYPVPHHHPRAQGGAFKELPGGGDLRIHHFILGRRACMTRR
ncbi:MFS transporter [Arthrobacter sp. ISL-69]|uniref:MFS transporter n=1 Tax=Arthrobacter sp. ISL-69 TaxID=2819113 RepID=UPI00288C39C4|nr:MFS transporter [Arthrobacter sp. ISL-69]